MQQARSRDGGSLREGGAQAPGRERPPLTDRRARPAACLQALFPRLKRTPAPACQLAVITRPHDRVTRLCPLAF